MYQSFDQIARKGGSKKQRVDSSKFTLESENDR